MLRETVLRELRERGEFDIVVIGGGATGLGCAVDAASRGHSVALIEGADFAKGTSGHSTNLVHGGVRYLRQGRLSLVFDALKERGRLLANAPHIVRSLPFVIPCYGRGDGLFYGTGLKVYDWMAGGLGFGASRRLDGAETTARLPGAARGGLRGGVLYYDGQFDDARLAIHLARTVIDRGGVAANYVRADDLLKEAGRVRGVVCADCESGERFTLRSKVVLNATGVFTDSIRRLDDPSASVMIAASQGAHLVLPKAFLPGDAALMVPKTSDGRVLFAIPWRGHVLMGTTDTPVRDITLEAMPKEEEIDFILDNAERYLARKPGRADVLSVFAGLRPLVRSQGSTAHTASLSRDHSVVVSESGLITITGGKWTTYRKMGEDAIDRAERIGGLEARPCGTEELPLHGGGKGETGTTPHLAVYGTDAPFIEALAKDVPALAGRIHPALPETLAEVVWAAREEMARRVEDVLCRRTRMLTLNARAALDSAGRVAGLLARETGRDSAWAREETAAFRELASRHLPT